MYLDRARERCKVRHCRPYLFGPLLCRVSRSQGGGTCARRILNPSNFFLNTSFAADWNVEPLNSHVVTLENSVLGCWRRRGNCESTGFVLEVPRGLHVSPKERIWAIVLCCDPVISTRGDEVPCARELTLASSIRRVNAVAHADRHVEFRHPGPA